MLLRGLVLGHGGWEGTLFEHSQDYGGFNELATMMISKKRGHEGGRKTSRACYKITLLTKYINIHVPFHRLIIFLNITAFTRNLSFIIIERKDHKLDKSQVIIAASGGDLMFDTHRSSQ